MDLAKAIRDEVWGQGFPEPVFGGHFKVEEQRVLGGKHLKLKLSRDGDVFDGIFFGQAEPIPGAAHLLFSLGINEWRGRESLQLEVRHWSPSGDSGEDLLPAAKPSGKWTAGFNELPF